MRVSMRPWPFSTVVLRDEFLRRRGVEIGLDFGFQRRLIALQRQQKIGLVRDDLGGDLDLTSHGVDGDEGAFELFRLGQMVEQIGDGGDLVGLLGHAELRQRQTGVGRVGAERVQRFEPLALVVGAARGLAVDGDEVVPARPQRRDPALRNSVRTGSGSIRLTRLRSQRSQGMPRWNSARTAAENRDGARPRRRYRRSRRKRRWWRRSATKGPRRADTRPATARGRPRARKNASKAEPRAPGDVLVGEKVGCEIVHERPPANQGDERITPPRQGKMRTPLT